MFVVIAGTKLSARSGGFVADFCPICRDVTPFQLYDLVETTHVYYVGLADSAPIGSYRRCRLCDVELAADRSHYRKTVTGGATPLDELVQVTHPDLQERHAARIDLEMRARQGRLSREERAALITEPLTMYEDRVRSLRGGTEFDAASGSGCFLACLLGVTTFALHIALEKSTWWKPALLLAGVPAAAAAGYTIWSMLTHASRFARRTIEPIVARSLAPLKPSLDELETALAGLRASGMTCGERLNAARLLRLISAPRALGTPRR